MMRYALTQPIYMVRSDARNRCRIRQGQRISDHPKANCAAQGNPSSFRSTYITRLNGAI